MSLPHATLLRRARKLLLLSKKDTKFICDLAAAFVPTNVILGVNSMPCTAMSEKTMNEDQTIRAALDRHWAASDANDFEAEHEIYHDDAVLEYPQSGERIRGRRNIQASRFAQPNKKRFMVRRVLGAAALWVTELVLTYDGLPSYTVSIMEFRDSKVARETLVLRRSLQAGGLARSMGRTQGFLLLYITGAGKYSIDVLCGIAATT